MRALIIGGTRFVGHHLVNRLLELGHEVTVFRRGKTADALPASVERLAGDRTEPGALRRALAGRSFDAAIDMIAMRGADTRDAVEALEGSVGRFVHVSTGQVYLVREACPAPAREEDYEGALVVPPPASSWERREWEYGVGKRECEDALEEAWAARGFPGVRLRIPIVHGRRDASGRLAGYVARLLDGGPLLVPEEPGAGLRHVHAPDVAAALVRLATEEAIERAYNLAPENLWTHEEFLARLAELVAEAGGPREVRVVARPLAELVSAGLFPACAPFASPWMSVLDAGRARSELDLQPAGFESFLPGLVADLVAAPPPAPPPAAEAFATQRAAELELAQRHAG